VQRSPETPRRGWAPMSAARALAQHQLYARQRHSILTNSTSKQLIFLPSAGCATLTWNITEGLGANVSGARHLLNIGFTPAAGILLPKELRGKLAAYNRTTADGGPVSNTQLDYMEVRRAGTRKIRTKQVNLRRAEKRKMS